MDKVVRRLLPSLAALRSFEAAARFGSFSRAAEEINLTQSAVSQQIRQLERFLGIALFERVRKRVVLTDAGAAYLRDIDEALDRVETATGRLLSGQGQGGVLNVGIMPTIAARWLIPRMPDFMAKHPGVVVNLTSRIYPFDFNAVDLDAAMHYGEGAWPGACADFFMGEELVAVCSPALNALVGKLQSPADLSRCTLLQHTTRPSAWQDWLKDVGFGHLNGRRGPKLDQFSMAIQAAVAGLGVTLLPRFLIEEELRSGTLLVPFDIIVRSAHSYYLVYPEAKRTNALVQAFRSWLLGQAKADGLIAPAASTW